MAERTLPAGFIAPCLPTKPTKLPSGQPMVTASVDVNVLHRNLLLALTAVAVECVEQHRVRAGELVGLAQILTSAPEGLFKKHGPSIAFHRGPLSSDTLRPDHALDLAF